MPKVKIDGREIEIPRHSTILDAAKRLGIEIPTLCHHPALAPYGACRLCVVEVTKGRWTWLTTAWRRSTSGWKKPSATSSFVGRVEDFSWRRLLDMYTCTECGRCNTGCPTHVTGKPLHPRELPFVFEQGEPLSVKAFVDRTDRYLLEATNLGRNRASYRETGAPAPPTQRLDTKFPGFELP